MSVSFMLTCYNQVEFIRDAVRGALCQDYQPLEVLVFDNNSNDGTLDIVREEIARYSGPHTVRLLTKRENIGLEVFAEGVEAARGTFIIGAHGDDVSYPGRTSALVRAWQSTGASLLGSNAQIINERSQVIGMINPESEPIRVSAATFAKKAFSPFAHGATLAWHRDVFENFPRLDQVRLRGGHDNVLPFRAALLNGHYYIGEPLLQWRVHGRNTGLEAADRTQDSSVKMETAHAYNLGIRICMLNDLDGFIARVGKRPDMAELHDIVVDEIMSLARRWTQERNSLFAEGRRPTWVGRQQLEQHRDYSKGYGVKHKRSKSALQKLLKKLARHLKLLHPVLLCPL